MAHEEVREVLRVRRSMREAAIESLEKSNREHANAIAANNEEILANQATIEAIDFGIEALEASE